MNNYKLDYRKICETDLAANLLLYKYEHNNADKHNEYITFKDINRYGRTIKQYLQKNGINGYKVLLLSTRDNLTNHYQNFFKVIEMPDGEPDRIYLADKAKIKDLYFFHYFANATQLRIMESCAKEVLENYNVNCDI